MKQVIFNGFIPRFYYWEVVIMIRKLCFSIVSVLMASLGGTIQALVGLAVLTFFLQLQNSFRPYESPTMNFAEEFGLLVRIATVVLGLGIEAKESTTASKTAFGAFIIIINSVFIMFCVYHIFSFLRVMRSDGVMFALGLSTVSKRKVVDDASKHSSIMARAKSSSIVDEKDGTFQTDNPVYVKEKSVI